MPTKYKPVTTMEGTQKRLRAHKHNSFTGHAAMIRKQCLAISESDTTTHAAKEIAERIAHLTHDLARALKTRVD